MLSGEIRSVLKIKNEITCHGGERKRVQRKSFRKWGPEKHSKFITGDVPLEQGLIRLRRKWLLEFGVWGDIKKRKGEGKTDVPKNQNKNFKSKN